MVNLFSADTSQMMTFLNLLSVLIPKLPVSFFLPNFGSGSPLGPWDQGLVSVGFWGAVN